MSIEPRIVARQSGERGHLGSNMQQPMDNAANDVLSTMQPVNIKPFGMSGRIEQFLAIRNPPHTPSRRISGPRVLRRNSDIRRLGGMLSGNVMQAGRDATIPDSLRRSNRHIDGTEPAPERPRS